VLFDEAHSICIYLSSVHSNNVSVMHRFQNKIKVKHFVGNPRQSCRTSPIRSQCYLSPDNGERTPCNHNQRGWCSIYLPQRDGWLSWPKWLVTYQWLTRPQTVTHPSINWAWCRVTTLIETNALPLIQATITK